MTSLFVFGSISLLGLLRRLPIIQSKYEETPVQIKSPILKKLSDKTNSNRENKRIFITGMRTAK